jgi:hypothetical protein
MPRLNGGTDYVSEAIYAQLFGDGYNYANAIYSHGKTWAMLNPEQQGALIQDAYEAGFFTINKGQWVEVDPVTKSTTVKPTLATFMQNVVPQLLSGQGAT